MNPRNAFDLADMVAGGLADTSQMGRASKAAARDVGLEADKASRGGQDSGQGDVADRD